MTFLLQVFHLTTNKVSKQTNTIDSALIHSNKIFEIPEFFLKLIIAKTHFYFAMKVIRCLFCKML